MHASRFTAVLLAVALFGAPRSARADDNVKDYGTLCLVGAIRTCASVWVSTNQVIGSTAATSYTEVVVRIANLQGTDPLDNTGGSLITRIGFTQPDVGTVSNLAVTAPAGSTIGNPGDAWIVNNKPIGGQTEFSAGLKTGVEGGILGCNSSDASPSSYFQTCGAGEYVTFTFRTSELITAAETQFAFKVKAVAVNGNSYSCRSEDDGGPHGCVPPPVTTVPEPASTALFATGLAVMGYVRRRRNSAVEANQV